MKAILLLVIALTVLALGASYDIPQPTPTQKAHVNPCIFTLCPQNTICVPVSKNRAECVRKKGVKRRAECRSDSDCSQQGSFCSEEGTCECITICFTLFEPVCDADGNQYSNRCVLDRTACQQQTTIPAVPCN